MAACSFIHRDMWWIDSCWGESWIQVFVENRRHTTHIGGNYYCVDKEVGSLAWYYNQAGAD